MADVQGWQTGLDRELLVELGSEARSNPEIGQKVIKRRLVVKTETGTVTDFTVKLTRIGDIENRYIRAAVEDSLADRSEYEALCSLDDL